MPQARLREQSQRKPWTAAMMRDRAVIRSIEVRGGIYGHRPEETGAQLMARWEHWVGYGTAAETNATAPEGTPDCSLVLGVQGKDQSDRWGHGHENLQHCAYLTTRDARILRGYARLLIELADLVEAHGL